MNLQLQWLRTWITWRDQYCQSGVHVRRFSEIIGFLKIFTTDHKIATESKPMIWSNYQYLAVIIKSLNYFLLGLCHWTSLLLYFLYLSLSIIKCSCAMDGDVLWVSDMLFPRPSPVMCGCHLVTHTSLLIPDSMGNTEQRKQTFSESWEQSWRINLASQFDTFLTFSPSIFIWFKKLTQGKCNQIIAFGRKWYY